LSDFQSLEKLFTLAQTGITGVGLGASPVNSLDLERHKVFYSTLLHSLPL
jgi:hypothetical protein